LTTYQDHVAREAEATRDKRNGQAVEAAGRMVGSVVGIVLARRIMRKHDAPPWAVWAVPVTISLLAYPAEDREEDIDVLVGWLIEAANSGLDKWEARGL
jgi:hypothetical protein